MARGFGSTLGSGTTDQLVLPNSVAGGGTLTYHIRVYKHGAGGANFGRFWNLGPSTTGIISYAFTDATAPGYTVYVLGTAARTASGRRQLSRPPIPGPALSSRSRPGPALRRCISTVSHRR
jgi:hypothetical protein